MSRAKKIKYIVIHTSAGWGNYDSMKNYWFSPKPIGLGWKTGGYHRIVMENGDKIEPYDFETVTNGVLRFNDECIHLCYQGGIDKVTKRPKDTRTDAQKGGLIDFIIEAFKWLQSKGVDTTTGIVILGHRDFSEDKNQNGSIDPNERVKECPCFNALEEYKWITYNNEQDYTLPKNRKKK